MCGIVGYTTFNSLYNENFIGPMVKSIERRGPDASAVSIIRKFENCNYFGHTRLSIIDTSSQGNQPMENGKFLIILNGEIYNYQSIKDKLLDIGVEFKSNSDTEVVLEAISCWGLAEAIKMFRGMWAFSLYNKLNGEIVLCRDRIGVKPLYYSFNGDILLYASELKAIMAYPKFEKKISNEGLNSYFRYGYINAPNTIFENTFKVEAGSYIIFSKKGNITLNKYWDIENIVKNSTINKSKIEKEGFDNTKKKLKNILIESFGLRMVADVPIGVFLSGGTDSSMLASILKEELGFNIDTFTIGFEEPEYDESSWGKKVAKHLSTNHNELICTEKDALDLIPELPQVYDEPFGDSSAIPTMLVSKFARESVKVALSADGGDELFFGYNRYKTVDKINKLPLKSSISWLIKNIPKGTSDKVYNLIHPVLKIPNFKDKYSKLEKVFSSNGLQEMYDGSLTYFSNDELQKLINYDFVFENKSELTGIKDIDNFVLITDCLNYLPNDILTKVDRASMSFSLEAREPFLDHKIIEYSASIPLKYKYFKGEKKYILKKMLEEYIPKEYIYRSKQGFGIPIDSWLRGCLKPLVYDFLSKDNLLEHQLLNIEYVNKLINDYYKDKGVNSHKIWFLLMFQMWYKTWIDNK